MHFLITAGGTREYIDPVRFISNASSGRMGYALAEAALKAGHKVTLITTVENQKSRFKNLKLKTVRTKNAAEMFAAVKKYFPRCDCLIMAAAVSDYTPVKYSKTKIKKGKKALTIKLKPTADILKWAGQNKIKNKKSKIKNKIVVGFALEDRFLRRSAEKKLRDKGLDMIVANAPAAIGTEESRVQIKEAGQKWQKIARTTKEKTHGRLSRL